MSTRSKATGTRWQTDLRLWLRSLDFDVEGLNLHGVEDEGDLVVKEGTAITLIEAKAEKSIDLAGYIDEAEREAANYEKHRGLPAGSVLPVAAVKRRNKGVTEGYIVIKAKHFFA